MLALKASKRNVSLLREKPTGVRRDTEHEVDIPIATSGNPLGEYTHSKSRGTRCCRRTRPPPPFDEAGAGRRRRRRAVARRKGRGAERRHGIG